jgi:deazaflavin-dependent oxidoreductase (nitroreductase family)
MSERTAERSSNNNLFHFLVRLQNPFMKWLLRSPLHGVVSRKYMLITVTGRRTGRQYTTPVQYGRAGDALVVITSRDYLWWRNLRGGADVTLHLRGETATGWAHVEDEAAAVERAARAVYPGLTDAQLARFLPESVAVVIAVGSTE